jgi:hypothetical protein
MEPIDRTGSPAAAPLTGLAAGVPYVALPLSSGSRRAPLGVAWHLLGPPRSQHAMAAALPMARLSAWRVYLRLLMLGARAPVSDPEDVVRCGAEDVVFSLPSPEIERAVAGFPAVAAALRARLPVDDAPIGLVGESVGAAVVLLLTLAEGEVPVHAGRPPPTPAAPQADPNDQGPCTASHKEGAPMTRTRLDISSVKPSERR